MLKSDMERYDEVWSRILGEKLHRLRKKNRYSGQAFAELIDVPYPRYYTVEKGTRPCQMSIVKKACLTLGINFIDFIKEIDELTSKEAKIEPGVEDDEAASLGEN